MARTPRVKHGLKCKPKYIPNPFGDVNKHDIRWRFYSQLLEMLCTPLTFPEIPMCSRIAKALRKLVLYMPMYLSISQAYLSTLPLVIFLAKTHNQRLFMKKYQTNFNRGASIIYLTSISQGHQKQGKSENLSQPRRTWRDRKTKCSVKFWMGVLEAKGDIRKKLR